MSERQAPPTQGSEENQAELRRRGTRHGAGHDTPAGPNTDRTVTPAKREQGETIDERGAESEEGRDEG